jgi:hypothetical protein
VSRTTTPDRPDQRPSQAPAEGKAGWPANAKRNAAILASLAVVGFVVLLAWPSSPPPPPPPPSPPPPSPSSTPTEETVRVLNVRGERASRAERTLENAGFVVVTSQRFSNQPSGTVLGQEPPAGARIDDGSTVALTVAKSYPRIPNVVGSKLPQARRALARDDFDVRVRRQTSSAAKDSVISQSPSGGTEARPGRTVTLVVAKPPPRTSTSEGSGGGGGGGCTPGYSPCLPPASDYDCAGGTGDGPEYTGRVTVTGSDPYGLDADGDGVGCE